MLDFSHVGSLENVGIHRLLPVSLNISSGLGFFTNTNFGQHDELND